MAQRKSEHRQWETGDKTCAASTNMKLAAFNTKGALRETMTAPPAMYPDAIYEQ